jgi:hypothetical protein
MSTLKEAAEEFLSHKRIAVAGVSRNGDTAANIIYKKLRDTGYEVFPVNPNADEVEGDKCYPDLASVPGGVEGVVIATHPEVTESVVKDCADLGIKRVWMHRSFGNGSVDEKAVRLCHNLGISVIPGSCPMMFCEPVDTGHKCIRWFLNVSGKQAKADEYAAI